MAFGRKRPRDSNFLHDWLNSGKAPDPDRLSKQAVDHDKWDREDVRRLRDEMPEFASEADRFCDVVETGNAFWDDAYFSLTKVDPHLIPEGDVRPKYLVNRAVQDEAMSLKEYEELRSLGTVGDDVAAAMGVITMRPDYETLFDKLEQEQKMADELDEMLSQLQGMEGEAADIDSMLKQLGEDGKDTEGRGPRDYQKQAEQLNKQMEELRKQMAEKGQDLQDALDKKRPTIRTSMKQAMQKANEEQKELANECQAWGLEPGELQRLPHQERMDLARRFNNPKLKRIAQLFGPMKRLMDTEQRRRVIHAVDEVYDLELGNDLSRVLPAEFAKLTHPLRKYEFYKDFAERRLPQYKMRGFEKVGKGPIIYCQDSSGSMGGDPEIWAKAVGLCLLHLARQQKRGFRNITFGSPGQIWEADFSKPEDYTPEKIIEFAEYSFMGGTDFVTPLSRALDHIREEHERTGEVKSDIVFATDGQCGVPQEWLDEFLAEKERLAFTCWGVSIGGHPKDEPLATICSDKVMTVKDLHSGEDVRNVFGGVGNMP